MKKRSWTKRFIVYPSPGGHSFRCTLIILWKIDNLVDLWLNRLFLLGHRIQLFFDGVEIQLDRNFCGEIILPLDVKIVIEANIFLMKGSFGEPFAIVDSVGGIP